MSDKENPLDKPYPLALYKSLEYGFITVSNYYPPEEFDESDRDARIHSGSVRISEPVEIQFQVLRNEEVIRNAVASCDAMEKEIRLEFEKKLVGIREQKRQLLALTHQVES